MVPAFLGGSPVTTLLSIFRNCFSTTSALFNRLTLAQNALRKITIIEKDVQIFIKSDENIDDIERK